MDPDGWWLGAAMSPDAGRAPMELVTNAVTARYAAMADGQVGHARLYRTGLNPAEQRRLLIRREMKAAIEHDQFALHYQPVYDSRQRNYSSWEAFARWSCPGLGEVRPREFIPIAEEAGLAHALGQWVLFTACRQAQKWSTEVSPAPHVAINLSTVQLHYADLVSEVSRALRETGLTPSSLLIEITESAILHDPTNTARTLRDLHALGVGIVLDDLGAGYSTLSNITNLPVDTVKIDRVFLSAVHRDHSAADIYEAIIGKARSLKLNIVAEGVETRADLDFVTQLGCDRVQGYFVSRPLPVEAALSAMRSGPGADGAAKNTATTPDNLIPFRAARARK
jgi:EAL domain-containing protein (putative c-di-GMP-specific phosphodiesterase class I)